MMQKPQPMPALAMLVFLAGCGGSPTADEDIQGQAFEDMRNEIRSVIDDNEREATVLALVDRLETDFAELQNTAERRRSRLRELNADYDATRPQFDAFLADYNEQLERSHADFRESHRALVESTTSEEWSALAKSNTRTMKQLAKSISSI